jgi:hypothetical protein
MMPASLSRPISSAMRPSNLSVSGKPTAMIWMGPYAEVLISSGVGS